MFEAGRAFAGDDFASEGAVKVFGAIILFGSGGRPEPEGRRLPGLVLLVGGRVEFDKALLAGVGLEIGLDMGIPSHGFQIIISFMPYG